MRENTLEKTTRNQDVEVPAGMVVPFEDENCEIALAICEHLAELKFPGAIPLSLAMEAHFLAGGHWRVEMRVDNEEFLIRVKTR